MKRVLGIVLFGVGLALGVFAAGLRFYVTPMATNIPYDLDSSTTVAEARNGVYFDAATGKPQTGTIASTTYVVPQPKLTNELTGDLAGKAVVWDVYSTITDSSSGKLLTESTETLALDRKTGAAIDWEGQSEDTDGHNYKLPFNAEQTTYPYWDGQMGKTVDIAYVATEEISGLTAYKYEHAPINAKITFSGVSNVDYQVARTIWVEPTTGQFLNVKQSIKISLGSTTLLSGDFEYTEDSKTKAADSISTNKSLLDLVSFGLPIGAGAGGLVLIAVGAVLFATAPKSTEAEAEAETVAY